MCDLFDLRGLPEADGRQIIHLESADPARDVADLSKWMLERFEVHIGRHSIYLLEKSPCISKRE